MLLTTDVIVEIWLPEDEDDYDFGGEAEIAYTVDRDGRHVSRHAFRVPEMPTHLSCTLLVVKAALERLDDERPVHVYMIDDAALGLLGRTRASNTLAVRQLVSEVRRLTRRFPQVVFMHAHLLDEDEPLQRHLANMN